MTYTEILEALHDANEIDLTDYEGFIVKCICGNDYLKVQEALEKQIPKKPNFIGDGYADGEVVYDEYECPNCGCIYETECSEGAKCCEECGQALDWSETDD